MQYFDFNDLIERYSCDFTVIGNGKTEYNDLGDKVVTPTSTSVKRGAIIGINERRIYRSDGVLTEKDKDLYMTESLGPIDKTFVIYDGNKYSVQTNPHSNHEFTGVWQYTLVWISAFKGGVTND